MILDVEILIEPKQYESGARWSLCYVRAVWVRWHGYDPLNLPFWAATREAHLTAENYAFSAAKFIMQRYNLRIHRHFPSDLDG